MIKKNYRCMLCALALTTSLVAVDVNPVFAQEAISLTAPAQVATQTTEKKNSAIAPLIGKTITNVSVSGAINTKQENILAATKIKVGDLLTEESIQQDSRAIYELGNFFDVFVNFEEVPEGVKVIYTVMENPVLNTVVIQGNTKVDTEKIRSMLTVKPGELLNTKTLNADGRNIEQYYREQGYIFTKVSDVSMGEGGVLTMTINEGVLEGFEVKGNEKTKDRVITREMKLKQGEAFNVKDARRSMQRVYNLGFFDDVNMKLNPGREPNAIVLETTVVEKRTGTFAVGGGYSKSDGLIGIIELGDTNFRGTGDAVKIHWEFGGDADSYDNYEFSYTKPWLDSKQTSASFRAYDMTHEYDDYENGGHLRETYDKNYKGIELSFGRPQSEYSTNYVTLKDRTDEYVEHVSGDTNHGNDPQYLKDNFGKTRSVSLAHVTDTRDNIYNPTEGARASISAEFAGIMGGDFDYNKYTFEDRHYFKVGRNHVIATKASVGYASGSMPESAQFDAGGQNSLRGYEDDQFKGENMVLGTVEYRFPIANKIQGAVFTDFGNAWSGNFNIPEIHASVGVGIQLETPIGPIRLDYGRGEDGGKTHFSFGGSF